MPKAYRPSQTCFDPRSLCHPERGLLHTRSRCPRFEEQTATLLCPHVLVLLFGNERAVLAHGSTHPTRTYSRIEDRVMHLTFWLKRTAGHRNVRSWRAASVTLIGSATLLLSACADHSTSESGVAEAVVPDASAEESTPTAETAADASSSDPSVDSTSIEGTTWQLVQLDGRDIDGTSESHMLRLDGGKLSAKAGCNQLLADYTLGSDGSLEIGLIASTKMMCENMADEQALMAALARAKSVRLFTGNLTLVDGSTDLAVFTPTQ